MRIAIIPARGGSQRIPRKNIAPFPSNPPGKPMIFYPIIAAKESGLFDLIVVSTDDDEIGALAFSMDAIPVPRATDDGTTGTQEIAARVLDELDAHGTACVIYPCSPLLLPEDLIDAKRQMVQNSAPYVYSVGPDGIDAGAFYWGSCHAFRARLPLTQGHTYELPAERVCDINLEADWRRAESLYLALKEGA